MTQGPPKRSKGVQILSKSRRKPERKKTASNKGTRHGKITTKLTSQGISNIERVMAARAGATGKLTIMKKVGEEGMKANLASRSKMRQPQAPKRNSTPAGGNKRKK